jgi:hypothetical protein
LTQPLAEELGILSLDLQFLKGAFLRKSALVKVHSAGDLCYLRLRKFGSSWTLKADIRLVGEGHWGTWGICVHDDLE